MHLCSLFMLVIQIKVAEHSVLLLEARPSVLNSLVHASKKLLNISDELECLPLDIFLIQSFGKVSVGLDKSIELVIDILSLLHRYGLKEGVDLIVSVLSPLFLFVI